MILQREGNRMRVDLDPILVIGVATVNKHADFSIGGEFNSPPRRAERDTRSRFI